MWINWQEIRKLLVVWVGDKSEENLVKSLQILKISLPKTRISLLTFFQTWLDREWEEFLDIKILGQDPTQDLKNVTFCLSQYQFELAIIFTQGNFSGYPSAYLCYLAGIPLRLGQGQEFGGGVFSHYFPKNEAENSSLTLLHQVGLMVQNNGFSPFFPD
ncbi:MAG: hypothetical protein HC890_14525 [Chloroflexaceae bacterium]|nr:hypothetical protein [Chloroflexaceae bacterium]